MSKDVTLAKIKSDSALSDFVLGKIKEEYMCSFETMEEFANKYSISPVVIRFIMKQNGLRKDMSKFNPSKTPAVIEKIAETKKTRYGDPHYNNPRKNEETCLGRYGVKHAKQVSEFNEKSKATFRSHFPTGSDEHNKLVQNRTEKRNKTLECIDFGEKVRATRKFHEEQDPEFSEKVNAKRQITTLVKFGVTNVSQLEEVKEKKRATSLKNCGEEFFARTEEFKQKYKKTCLEKYGVEHYSQTPQFMEGCTKNWEVDGKTFDSKWEIYYYYYLVDSGIKFRTQIPLEYDFHGEKRYYFCDFFIEDTGEYVEIKNPAMLDESGTLKVLWGKGCSEERLAYLSDICKHKTECMTVNNVKVLSDAEYFKDLEALFKEKHKELRIIKK